MEARGKAKYEWNDFTGSRWGDEMTFNSFYEKYATEIMFVALLALVLSLVGLALFPAKKTYKATFAEPCPNKVVECSAVAGYTDRFICTCMP